MKSTLVAALLISHASIIVPFLLGIAAAIPLFTDLAPSGIPAAELAHRWSLLPHLSAAEAAVWDAERANDRKRFPLPASRWE